MIISADKDEIIIESTETTCQIQYKPAPQPTIPAYKIN